MDIKEFIDIIKKRPESFIGEPKLENLTHYIDGFLINNYFSNNNYENDRRFKKEFSEWCQNEIAKEFSASIEKKDFITNNSRSYVYFINIVESDEREKIKLFFKLFDLFFTNEIRF